MAILGLVIALIVTAIVVAVVYFGFVIFRKTRGKQGPGLIGWIAIVIAALIVFPIAAAASGGFK